MLKKYKNMRKWMVEVLKKIENCGIKIARVNSILITKSINLQLFTLILYGVGVLCDRTRFSVFSPFIVVVVVVVTGQTVGSISSKTLADDCLYTLELELCTASMIATS